MEYLFTVANLRNAMIVQFIVLLGAKTSQQGLPWIEAVLKTNPVNFH